MDNKILSRLHDRKESIEEEIKEKEIYINRLRKMLDTVKIQIWSEEEKEQK